MIKSIQEEVGSYDHQAITIEKMIEQKQRDLKEL